MARPLTLVAWNVNGVAGRRAELACFASEYDADVVLLSETHLRPQHRFNLPAYATYRTDRPVTVSYTHLLQCISWQHLLTSDK